MDWVRNKIEKGLEVATKTLKVQRIRKDDPTKRKLVISTNLILMTGMLPGTHVQVGSLGTGKGMRIVSCSADQPGAKLVHQRDYTRAKGIVHEALFDIRKQALLQEALLNATHVRVTFRRNEVLIEPVEREAATPANLNTFVACTGGVDVACLEQHGFEVSAVLEYRPQEARDSVDKTETGAMSALANASNLKYLFNEDIYHADMQRIAELVSENIAHLHLSLQCDDFSPLKSKKERERAVNELATTMDMVFPAIDLIRNIDAPTLMVENVEGFGSSPLGIAFATQLRRMGYTVYQNVCLGKEQAGLTTRKRWYLVATKLAAPFHWPEQATSALHAWNDVVAPRLHQCKDVTENSSVQKAIGTPRLRVIAEGDATSPTLTKSQDRGTKDSVYIQTADNRIYKPSMEILRLLQGIPASFTTEMLTNETATEVIGQSIDVPMHGRIVAALKRHIEAAQAALTTPRALTAAAA